MVEPEPEPEPDLDAPVDGGPGASPVLRPMRHADLPLLSTWLAEPLVARWWSDDPSPAAVEAVYGPSLDGEDPTEVFLVVLGGRPVGLVQRYPVHAYPDDAEALEALVEVPQDAWSLDHLLGDPRVRGRGLAAVAIRACAEDLWSAHPGAGQLLVPVHAENAASWRSLENAGFVRVARGPLEPDNPADTPDHVILRLRRPGSGPGGG